MNDIRLLFDHALSHALFERKRETPDAVPDWSIEDLVDYHWLLLSEMTRRGFVHKDYDDLDGIAVGKSTVEAVKMSAEQIQAKGVYLPAPHADLIWRGKKKLIIKSRSFAGMLNKPLYWADSDYVYGVLKLTEIKPIDLREFQNLRPLHLVTDKEKAKWWEENGPISRFYSYEFKVIERFKKPQPYKFKRGTQVYFGSPEWKSDDELTVAIDIDGTIADTDLTKPIPEAFIEATPKPLAQESMREIKDFASIIIYSGREPRYYEVTAKWLEKYQIPYDKLILGKPVADLYVDDLAVNFEDNWRDVVGIAHAAGEMLAEKQGLGEAVGPGLQGTGMTTMPATTHQEAVRTVRSSASEELLLVDYTAPVVYLIEDGIIIEKASLPIANKPARRYYELDKLPEQIKFEQVLVEMKFDGMDMMLSKDRVWSGRGLDKTSRVPYIVKELSGFPHTSFIMHGQAQMFSDGKPLHRTDAIGFINGSAPVEEGRNLRITAFDLIELDGKDLKNTPMLERLKILRKEFKGSEHVPILKESQSAITTPDKIPSICKRMGDLEGSEGAMIFDAQSKWTSKTINFGWAKWKKQAELDILVVKKEKTEGGWRYLGAIGPINEAAVSELSASKVAELKGKKWLILGHTHVTSVDVAEGDVLRIRALEVVRNGKYDYSYQNAVPMYAPEKNVPDGLDVAEELSGKTLAKADDVAGWLFAVDREGHKFPTPESLTRVAKSYEELQDESIQKSPSPFKCMECSESPTVECLWANGMAHSWFCDKCLEEWKAKKYNLPYGGKDHWLHYGDSQSLDKVRKIYGVASKHWSKPLTAEESRKAREEAGLDPFDVKKQGHFTDPEGGAQGFMSGRLGEGVRTTAPVDMNPSAATAPSTIGAIPGLEKIQDVETYDPKKVKDDRVLLDDHRITHAWWATLEAGKPLIHDKPTVKALHDAIAREIIRRGMKHDSPLGTEQKGGFISSKEMADIQKGAFEYMPSGGLPTTSATSDQHTVSPGGAVGVQGYGGGERVPEDRDKTFRETTPLQYVQVEPHKLIIHSFFKGSVEQVMPVAQEWQRRTISLAKAQGLKADVYIESFEGGVVGTIILNTDSPLIKKSWAGVPCPECKSEDVGGVFTVLPVKSLSDLTILEDKIVDSDTPLYFTCEACGWEWPNPNCEIVKQIWPGWVGHRRDPKTGKILKPDRPLVNPMKSETMEAPDGSKFISQTGFNSIHEGEVVISKQMPPEQSTTDKPITWKFPPEIDLSTNWSMDFLGTSGEKTFPRTDCDDEQCRNDKRLNACAVYHKGGTNILLDCGSEDLARKTPAKLDAVCITHAHPDHVSGLQHLSKDIPIYMHRDTWRDLLENEKSLAQILSDREVHLFSTHNAVKIGAVRVRWIPVEHSLKVKTFGIRLDATTLYTPDFLKISDQWLKGVTHWIIDGASLKRDIEREKEGEGFGHQSILHSLEQAMKDNVEEVIVTHVGHTGVKSGDMPETLKGIAKEIGYEGNTISAVDSLTISGAIAKAEPLDTTGVETKDGEPYPAQFYKGPDWLHSKAYTYIIHHHFPYGPIVNKDGTIKEGTADDVHITGPPPSEAGGNPPKDAISAPREPDKAEAYVIKELGLKKGEESIPNQLISTLGIDSEVLKGIGGFREHWETRQDTGDTKMFGWTFLTYPWPKTRQFFSGTIKGMTTSKPPIPKASSSKFPRGWLDVQGIRTPVILGGAGASAERARSGFYEIIEEGTFEYGVQRKNFHEYFFHGKLLNGRWVFRLLQLASGSARWLAFRSPEQKPADPIKHADEGYWKLVGETEAPVESPGGEKE